MNPFLDGLVRYLDPGWQNLAAAVSIGIIGAGGLGSNCAMHLVRSGFANFVLADPDLVEASNLNRQAFFLHQIGRPKVLALRDNMLAVNPDARILAHPERVDETSIAALFGACQAVVEAVDEARTKKLVVEAMATADRFVVSASGLGGSGQTGHMTMRALGPNLVVVGDLITPCDADHPPLAPGVGMAAAMQADAVLNHFLAMHTENRS